MQFRNVIRQPKKGITGVRHDPYRNIYNSYITSALKEKFQKTFTDFFEACCWRKTMENQLGYVELNQNEKVAYRKQKKIEKNKRYYENHKPRILSKQKDYYNKNKEAVK